MIGFKIGISWKIVLNETSFEWHELQHPISTIVAKNVLHCFSHDNFKLETTFSFKGRDIELYTRIVDGKYLEAICLDCGETKIENDEGD